MGRNSLYNAISFRYALLDCYKKLSLNENELVVCLMIDHLFEQGNHFITADMLALKMTFSVQEINLIMSSLMKKGYLSYEEGKGKKLNISLARLRDLASQEISEAIAREDENISNKEKSKNLSDLIAFFEDRLARTLSPIETSTIGEWLNYDYSVSDIKNALLDCLKANKKTIKAVDRTLTKRRKQEDLEKEGVSVVNDRWDKNVEETVKAARALWGLDDDGSR